MSGGRDASSGVSPYTRISKQSCFPNRFYTVLCAALRQTANVMMTVPCWKGFSGFLLPLKPSTNSDMRSEKSHRSWPQFTCLDAGNVLSFSSPNSQSSLLPLSTGSPVPCTSVFFFLISILLATSVPQVLIPHPSCGTWHFLRSSTYHTAPSLAAYLCVSSPLL